MIAFSSKKTELGLQISEIHTQFGKQVKIRKAEDGLPKEFVRELESLQRVLHPNVIQIREVFIGKTNINLVLHPFCETDLEKVLKNAEQPFSIEDVKKIMI